MAEEEKKKPKIDLRARLGKKTVGGGNPSIPPPMATGASIPAPPFASKAPEPAPAKPKFAEPQAIKIEMSEEVIQAQKKGKSRILAIAVGMAFVGGMIGFAIGGGQERNLKYEIALEGSKLLTEDIDKANVEIGKLAEALIEAKRGLSDGEYPEAAILKLADLSVPFDGTYLAGKGTGLMSGKINMALVDFAGKSSAANAQKERLHRVLTGSKTALTELLAQKEKPKFNWAVYVVPGPHGPMAAMKPVSKPFLINSKEKIKDKDGKEQAYKWPEELEYPTREKGKTEKLKLYTDGNPVSRTPLLIPVEPTTQAAVCPNDTMVRLRGEIVKLEQLLKGDRTDPTNEKKGLTDLGTSLMEDLKAIGTAG